MLFVSFPSPFTIVKSMRQDFCPVLYPQCFKGYLECNRDLLSDLYMNDEMKFTILRVIYHSEMYLNYSVWGKKRLERVLKEEKEFIYECHS